MSMRAKPTMRTVRLYGDLAKTFGREFRFAVRTPAEAIRALRATVKGFREYLAARPSAQYHLRVGHTFRGEEDLGEPCGRNDVIKLIPATAGSSAAARVIVGIVLIVVGYYFGQPTLVQAGVALVVGGVAEMLMPKPRTDGSSDDPNNKPSKYFNGVVNPVAQGNPVPVRYGEGIAGGIPVDVQLWAEDVPLTEA